MSGECDGCGAVECLCAEIAKDQDIDIDEEMTVMKVCVVSLNGLEERKQRRVVEYLAQRYLSQRYTP